MNILNEDIKRIKNLMNLSEMDGLEDYFTQDYTGQEGPHDEDDMAPDGMGDGSDKEEEFTEDEISEEGEESTSTTSTGAGSATSWSQGHTKGPGNQTGNTNWAEVVGSQLKRGPGNPLK